MMEIASTYLFLCNLNVNIAGISFSFYDAVFAFYYKQYLRQKVGKMKSNIWFYLRNTIGKKIE